MSGIRGKAPDSGPGGLTDQGFGLDNLQSSIANRQSKRGLTIDNRQSSIINSRGVALIMVLWVVTILSVIVLEFAFAMRTEVNITQHYKTEVQLYAYAEGGIQRAVAELIYKHDPKIQQMRRAPTTEEIPPEKKEWATDGRAYVLPYDQGTCEIRVTGEAGKVNINMVTEATLRKIIGQLGLEGEARDIVTDSILDWIDPDDFVRINGAENDYYRSLKEPYDCKNGFMDSIEELLLVRGVTPDLFYGKKGTQKNEGEEAGTQGQTGLRDIFSIYSYGEQIDINSASVPVLKVVLGIPAVVAQSIVRAREEKPFANQQDLVLRVPEMASLAGQTPVAYQSAIPYYTIEARGKGKEGGAVQGIKVIVKIDPTERNGYKVLQWVDRVL